LANLPLNPYFHTYVCAAFLALWSSQLCDHQVTADFESTLSFLLKLPTDEWDLEEAEILIENAKVIHEIESSCLLCVILCHFNVAQCILFIVFLFVLLSFVESVSID
jgi:hypothetical protein